MLLGFCHCQFVLLNTRWALTCHLPAHLPPSAPCHYLPADTPSSATCTMPCPGVVFRSATTPLIAFPGRFGTTCRCGRRCCCDCLLRVVVADYCLPAVHCHPVPATTPAHPTLPATCPMPACHLPLLLIDVSGGVLRALRCSALPYRCCCHLPPATCLTPGSVVCSFGVVWDHHLPVPPQAWVFATCHPVVGISYLQPAPTPVVMVTW